MDVLKAQIGVGDVLGTVEVDQLYAHRQHEHLEYEHPRGGQALFLSTPLTERFTGYMQNLAEAVLNGDLNVAMAENMEDLAGQVAELAPIEHGILRGSAHPTVRRAFGVVYDRPPKYPPMTEEELDAFGGTE